MCMSWKATQKNVKTFTVSNSNWFLSQSDSDCSLPWFHVDQKYPFNIPLQINLVQLYTMRIALILSHLLLELVMFSFLLLNMQTHNSISIETMCIKTCIYFPRIVLHWLIWHTIVHKFRWCYINWCFHFDQSLCFCTLHFVFRTRWDRAPTYFEQCDKAFV